MREVNVLYGDYHISKDSVSLGLHRVIVGDTVDVVNSESICRSDVNPRFSADRVSHHILRYIKENPRWLDDALMTKESDNFVIGLITNLDSSNPMFTLEFTMHTPSDNIACDLRDNMSMIKRYIKDKTLEVIKSTEEMKHVNTRSS